MKVFIFLLPDSESSQSVAVVLENVTDNMSREILSILVENISGLDDNSFSLEIIWESDSAVVTFNNPAGKKWRKWQYSLWNWMSRVYDLFPSEVRRH